MNGYARFGWVDINRFLHQPHREIYHRRIDLCPQSFCQQIPQHPNKQTGQIHQKATSKLALQNPQKQPIHPYQRSLPSAPKQNPPYAKLL